MNFRKTAIATACAIALALSTATSAAAATATIPTTTTANVGLWTYYNTTRTMTGSSVSFNPSAVFWQGGYGYYLSLKMVQPNSTAAISTAQSWTASGTNKSLLSGSATKHRFRLAVYGATTHDNTWGGTLTY